MLTGSKLAANVSSIDRWQAAKVNGKDKSLPSSQSHSIAPDT
jgi:hypothetical protein